MKVLLVVVLGEDGNENEKTRTGLEVGLLYLVSRDMLWEAAPAAKDQALHFETDPRYRHMA